MPSSGYVMTVSVDDHVQLIMPSYVGSALTVTRLFRPTLPAIRMKSLPLTFCLTNPRTTSLALTKGGSRRMGRRQSSRCDRSTLVTITKKSWGIPAITVGDYRGLETFGLGRGS